jgi:uncharacterized alpha-E superfamily protein
MLARVAEALYWMARDLERAIAVARLLEVGHATSLEGDLSNGAGRRHVWEPVLGIAGGADRFHGNFRRAEERSVTWYLTLSDDNPDAVVACLSRARDRARAIRDRLPTEVFEAIGAARVGALAWQPRRIAREGLYAFCHEVRAAVARVDGTIDRGVRRDELWHFLNLGRSLERATQTVRLLIEYRNLAGADDATAVGLGDWRTALRVVSAYEAFLRVGSGSGSNGDPEAFLLMDHTLPSSVTYSLHEFVASLDALKAAGVASSEPRTKAAMLSARRTVAAAAQPAADDGMLERLAVRLGDVHDAFARTYFTDPEGNGVAHAQAVYQAQN